ncbi:gluconate 5-dehydrogenase [Fonsecaea pedrosoi]|nr:gluconate 5-dehydrogenase [Fonsecaea pedrosoi]
MISSEPIVEPVTNGHSSQKAGSARDLFSLDRRTIIVTGATGGMGIVVVKAILQSGADVIAIDREAEPKSFSGGKHAACNLARAKPVLLNLFESSLEDLQSTAEKSGTIASYYQCDISDLESTYAVFENAVSSARYPLRGLVNCAAIGWVGPSISFPVDDAKRIIEVNLVGTLVCAQAAARLVKKHGFAASFVFIASMSGYVVNKSHQGQMRDDLVSYRIASYRIVCDEDKHDEEKGRRHSNGDENALADHHFVLSGQGTPNAAYAASKAGVHQLTRNLASEWGSPNDTDGASPSPSIRVNSVSPGVIRTPMTAGVLSNSHFEHTWTEETMLKRLSVPDDYIGPIIFLLSDASSYVTGSDLLVDGGYTRW